MEIMFLYIIRMLVPHLRILDLSFNFSFIFVFSGSALCSGLFHHNVYHYYVVIVYKVSIFLWFRIKNRVIR